MQADEVTITCVPDLANLRNAKSIVDLLKQSRKHDAKPHLVINMANVPKRPEISVKEFEQALDLKATAIVEYDPETFGQASNNGQMIEELNAKAKSAQAFRDVALTMSRRKEIRVEKKSPLAPLAPILQRFNIKI